MSLYSCALHGFGSHALFEQEPSASKHLSLSQSTGVTHFFSPEFLACSQSPTAATTVFTTKRLPPATSKHHPANHNRPMLTLPKMKLRARAYFDAGDCDAGNLLIPEPHLTFGC